jgi:hypothetical protein
MQQNLKPEERELIKLIGFFKKKAQQLIAEERLPAEYNEMIETSDKLVEHINLHANKREVIIGEREQLQQMMKDNAQCPKCASAEKLKHVGIDKNEQGWKSNKYKCRNCNIEFVWNAPNNPWDMIPYVENFVFELRKKMEGSTDRDRELVEKAISDMENNMTRLKPIVEASDQDWAELEAQEKDLAELVHRFKKQLMIEKIRMED